MYRTESWKGGTKVDRLGKIEIADSLLLDLLDFKGGRIFSAGRDANGRRVTWLVIEHDDMPKVVEGG